MMRNKLRALHLVKTAERQLASVNRNTASILSSKTIRTQTLNAKAVPSGQPLGTIKVLNSRLDAIERFRDEQRQLDSGKTLKEREDLNLALGDGLNAQMQFAKSEGEMGPAKSSWLASALKSADASLAREGFGDTSNGHRDKRLLLGGIDGNKVRRSMQINGLDIKQNNLAEALRRSTSELRMLKEGKDAPDENLGLSRLAVNSVVDGLSSGLNVRRKNPIDGTSTGSLRLTGDRFAHSIATNEMRSVSAGKMTIGETMVGLD